MMRGPVILRKFIILLILAGSLVLQGCAGNPVSGKSMQHEPLQQSESVLLKQSLANDLGEVKVLDVVKDSHYGRKTRMEYQVLEEYTAASGNRFRRVEQHKLASAKKTKEVICKSIAGQWYWPRQIIFE